MGPSAAEIFVAVRPARLWQAALRSRFFPDLQKLVELGPSAKYSGPHVLEGAKLHRELDGLLVQKVSLHALRPEAHVALPQMVHRVRNCSLFDLGHVAHLVAQMLAEPDQVSTDSSLAFKLWELLFFPFNVKTVSACSVSPGLLAYQVCIRTHNESVLAA